MLCVVTSVTFPYLKQNSMMGRLQQREAGGRRDIDDENKADALAEILRQRGVIALHGVVGDQLKNTVDTAMANTPWGSSTSRLTLNK